MKIKLPKHSNPIIQFLIRFWLFTLAGFLLLVIFIGGVRLGMLGKLPKVEQLENPPNNLATVVYSSDGKILGKYYYENRTLVKYDQLSSHLVNALIATEDERFSKHSGFDFRSFGRAIFNFGGAGGASTITQQLAKMLFTEKASKNIFQRLIQKIKEWVIAIELEKRYTKEEIISMYFNEFDFIHQAVGINSAAQIYFGKSQDSLQLHEAAMLVGMCKNPSLFNPYSKPLKALERRNVVLKQMERNGFLTKDQKDSVQNLEIGLNFRKSDHNSGLATHFREVLRQDLLNWANENGYNIYRDGLKVTVSINYRMQLHAEAAAEKHLAEMQSKFFQHWKGRVPWEGVPDLIDQAMKKSERYKMMKEAGASDSEIKTAFNEKYKMRIFAYNNGKYSEKDSVMSPLDSIKYYKYFLQPGLMAMDPHTGQILAWVGSLDHKYFKYDHVNKTASRQVGSTFKPFVYTLAVDNGWSPCDVAPNVPVVFEDYENWSPRNSDGKEGGEMQLQRALANSVNHITAFLMKQLGPNGPKNVINLVRKMGISSPIEAVPSICLGTADISVYEMVGAFATFANKGVFTEPYYLVKIEDKNGTVLYNQVPQTTEALSEQTAYVMVKMMEKVTQIGTGTRIRFRYGIPWDIPVYGKTGTTQNNSDAWFIGVHPQVAAGVWVGCDDRAVHFRSTDLGQGASLALPIWAYFMKSCLDDKQLKLDSKSFEAPEKLDIKVDCKVEKGDDEDAGDPDSPFNY